MKTVPLSCPKCETKAEFAISIAKKETKTVCPKCGDVNMFPGRSLKNWVKTWRERE